jgi:hypothetical protein
VCLIDGSRADVEDASLATAQISDAAETILLSLFNYSESGNLLEVSYPIELELLQDGQSVFSQSNIGFADL